MKNSSLRWRFINQSNPSESVIVHDENSAQNLAQLLQKIGGDWIMQEERSLNAAPQPAPKAEPRQATPVQEQAQAMASAVYEAVAQAAEKHFEQLQVEQHETEPHESEVKEPQHTPSMEVASIEAPVESMPESMPESIEEEQQLQVQAETPAPAERRVSPPPAPKKPEKRERRGSQRYMTEFRVILISGSSSFRTMSQDVSLGGMRLKKTIPASFLKEKCVAYVSHKDLSENIEIVCNVIGDPQDPCRIQFVQPNAVQLKRLSDWLIEHNQPILTRNKVAS